MLKENVVEATLEMGYAIMEEAGLSFLGKVLQQVGEV
jgi:ABC-type dipeptide/oligopeptide/nickel transport system permease subunit